MHIRLGILGLGMVLGVVWGPSSFGQDKKTSIVGVYYFRHVFGHVHQTASAQSPSVTTIACGHPLKVIEQKADWAIVQVGGQAGYVDRDALLEKRPECFQDKYPKYMNALNLELSELYYWGRLYDHYVEGRSKVQ